jgi:antitoxin VapB
MKDVESDETLGPANAESPDQRRRRLLRFLREEIWRRVPSRELGRRLTKKEEDEILGYGDDGV